MTGTRRQHDAPKITSRASSLRTAHAPTDGVDAAEHAWNRMTAQTLQERARQGATVLLPIGSTEQHGPHLPTGTDDFLATEICRRVAVLLEPEHPVVITPPVWCGLAEHHMAFGGTFSLTLGTLHALLRDLCSSILRAGFRNVLIVNGHGGNIPGLTAISPSSPASSARPSPAPPTCWRRPRRPSAPCSTRTPSCTPAKERPP